MTSLRRVMCVEDDPDIRMILAFSLAPVGGYEVLCCAGGQAALLQAPDFRPDLVLLDLMMPDLSSPQTLAALRAWPVMQGVPVVFLTAKAMPDALEQLLQHDASRVIVKPFNPMTLPADIRPCWEHGRGPGTR